MHTVGPHLRTRWAELHSDLSESHSIELAGLFSGYVPPNYQEHQMPVMYVGKATAGSFKEKNAEELYFNGSGSAFFQLAREISKRTGGDESLVNIAWSNVCKIGVLSGDPNDQLVLAQAGLAVDSLRQEIVRLKPKLVVFVCEGFADRVIYEALRLSPSEFGGKRDFATHETPGKPFYSRLRGIDGMPPIVWAQHPERKSNDQKSLWLDQIEKLLK